MNWVEQKIIKLEKMISYVYCKVKNLTNIHNELDGLQGGQEGQYYHLTEEQYNNIDNIFYQRKLFLLILLTFSGL